MKELLDEFINSHLYKLSVGIGLAYGGVLLSMALDLIFGLRKAWKLGEVTTSTGLKKTADKARKYFSPMLSLTIIDVMLSIHLSVPIFTILWAVYCAFCEFKSITEKSWQKAELREAAKTMNVIIKNKEDIAKILVELLNENKKEEEKK